MDGKALSDYVFTAKYAKSIDGVPETYAETVERYLSTFDDLPPSLKEDLRVALTAKKISGSQRGLQFGGAAIRQKNARVFNCSSSYADRPRFFAEAIWLLLCGCGVGFSVQRHHTDKLPSIKEPQGSFTYVIPDSIEGWSDAVHELMNSYFTGSSKPQFDYSIIRPKGSPLTHGGVAPGPDPLRAALDHVDALLTRCLPQGRLRPIDVFDTVMHLSNAVLAGGIRRSACLTAFDIDDEDMMTAKTGNWFVDNPQRARANISAVILPHHSYEQYARLFQSTKSFGEPGFLFLPSNQILVNPCAEIAMCPTLIKYPDGSIVPKYSIDMLDKQEMYERGGYTYESGWSMCNLSTVNCAAINPEELPAYARLAAILGTWQASLTSLPYLGEVSEQIIRREALLGVSLTGLYSTRAFFEKKLLEDAAHAAVQANLYYAKHLGINPASRVTCVKPEGTASIALGGVSSGIHPYHAKKYIRRVQATAQEPLYQFVEQVAPDACEKSVWGNADSRVISFACEAPSTAITKADITAAQHLDDVITVNQHWVRNGDRYNRVDHTHHNVSVTVSVGEDEWDTVQDKIWENRGLLTGVSLLSSGGDYVYQQAPLQEVSEGSSDEARQAAWLRWNELRSLPNPEFNYMAGHSEDYTSEPACAGGACSIPLFDTPQK